MVCIAINVYLVHEPLVRCCHSDWVVLAIAQVRLWAREKTILTSQTHDHFQQQTLRQGGLTPEAIPTGHTMRSRHQDVCVPNDDVGRLRASHDTVNQWPEPHVVRYQPPLHCHVRVDVRTMGSAEARRSADKHAAQHAKQRSRARVAPRNIISTAINLELRSFEHTSSTAKLSGDSGDTVKFCWYSSQSTCRGGSVQSYVPVIVRAWGGLEDAREDQEPMLWAASTATDMSCHRVPAHR
jgi:hypothetical protein